MRAYISAPYELKDDACEIRDFLADEGILALCGWVLMKDELSHAETRDALFTDLTDIDKADIFVQLNPSEWRYRGTGGRHVELGYAIAKAKYIFVIGESTNIFHEHPLVKVLKDIKDLPNAIREAGWACI